MAKLIACRACGNQISKDAQACPRCGAPPRRGDPLKLLVACVGTVVVVALVAGEMKNEGRPTPPAPQAQRAIVVAPAAAAADPDDPISASPIVLTAQQLYQAYKTNEVSADEQYRRRVLIVSGVVDAIKKDFSDEPYLELRVAGDFDHVDARFPESRTASLSGLRPGAKVTVRCIGNNVVLGSPQLKDCVLQ